MVVIFASQPNQNIKTGGKSINKAASMEKEINPLKKQVIRNSDGTFAKGSRGGGRKPRVRVDDENLAELSRREFRRNHALLVKMRDDPNSPSYIKLQCIEQLNNRGFGRISSLKEITEVQQMQLLEKSKNLGEVSDEQLESIIRQNLPVPANDE